MRLSGSSMSTEHLQNVTSLWCELAPTMFSTFHLGTAYRIHLWTGVVGFSIFGWLFCHIAMWQGKLLCAHCANANRFHINHVGFLVEVTVRTLLPLSSCLWKMGGNMIQCTVVCHNSFSAIVLFCLAKTVAEIICCYSYQYRTAWNRRCSSQQYEHYPAICHVIADLRHMLIIHNLIPSSRPPLP